MFVDFCAMSLYSLYLHYQITTMWVLEKLRESMENMPLELSRYMGKSEEDIFLSSKASLSQKLHNNILTPDKIPEFCLPPRLCKRSLLQEAEGHSQTQVPKSCNYSKVKDVNMKNCEESEAWKTVKKPLPFSAEGYGLVGIYESPNTRRKESLFHSKTSGYMLDRSTPTPASKLEKERNVPKKTVSGFFPTFQSKELPETGSTGRKTPSTGDSSPLISPYRDKFSSSTRLRGATSCPSLIGSRENRGKWKRAIFRLTSSPSCPPVLGGSSLTLAPPALFPLDVLQRQQRLQQEHVLSLQGRGKVRLFAEHTAISTDTFPSLSTVRVRVMSVEGLRDESDRRPLNCAVNLCLSPGKLQEQESATIRNSRSPVFNEDFFFTDLSREDLLELQLRVKVVNKPASGTLRRGVVVGTAAKPLSQLLSLKNG